MGICRKLRCRYQEWRYQEWANAEDPLGQKTHTGTSPSVLAEAETD